MVLDPRWLGGALALRDGVSGTGCTPIETEVMIVKTIVWNRRLALVAALGVAVTACEPSSIAEARDQLGRQADGVLQLMLPIADTTYFVSELLSDQDTVTTPDGLLGVRIQSSSVDAVSYGQFLTTAEVSNSISISLLTGSPGAMVMATSVDTLRFVTPQGSDVVGGVIETGYLVRTVTNNTGCAGTVDFTIRDGSGATVVPFPTAGVADGATYVDSVSAASASMAGFLEVTIDAATTGTCVPNIGASVASDITVRALTLTSVTLDNVSETVSVEQYREIDGSQVDFVDLEDAIRQSTLHSAFMSLAVVNSAGLPLVFDNFTMGAVQLDGTGQPLRDGAGVPLYEESVPGAPILVSLTDPGQTTFSVARQATKSLQVSAAPLVDRIVDMILDGDRVALLAAATATGGDGTVATLTNQDEVSVTYEFVVGLDITIPMAGVTFTRNQTIDGVSLDGQDAADIAARLVSVAVVADIMNDTPFGVEIDLALAPDSLDDTVDIFALPNVIRLNRVTLAAPDVDVAGIPLAPVSDQVSLGISGSDSEVVLGDIFTAGIRITLVPGNGGAGRGAVRPTDGVAVDASVDVQIRRGSQ